MIIDEKETESVAPLDGVVAAMAEAERKAWDSLARYKFLMFGYHAAQWVTLNKLLDDAQPNPFRPLVKCARELIDGSAEEPEPKEDIEDFERGDVKAGQIADIENLSWWIWSDKRAVEGNALRGHRIEELTEAGAERLLSRLRKIKKEVEVREADGRQQAPDPDNVPGVEKGGASRRGGNKADLPATRKQLNYLKALVEEALEDGVPAFEQASGVGWDDLTREDASSWIKQFSGGGS